MSLVKLFFRQKILAIFAIALLSGCAAKNMPGFQNTYQGYNVPETLVQDIRNRLKTEGLPNAQIKRDTVGRIQLVGNFRNEDEIDHAFFIIQSIVGLKSTSPFYPENIQNKRWDSEAQKMLALYAYASKRTEGKGVKRALIIGINEFEDQQKIPSIQGADDARTVLNLARQSGYQITALIGSEATKKNIEAVVLKLEKETKPIDTLLIYVSTHGVPIPNYSKNSPVKMYILPYDAKNNVYSSLLSDVGLRQLELLPTKQTYSILDTCYSGNTLSDVPYESKEYILKTNNGKPEIVSVPIGRHSGPEFVGKGISYVSDARSDEPQLNENSKSIVDINKISKLVHKEYGIITATGKDKDGNGEESLGPLISKGTFNIGAVELRGSFFTQSFIHYLKINNGNVQPAFKEASEFTRQKALELANKTQTPQYQHQGESSLAPMLFN